MKIYGISKLSTIPVRSSASHSSEMISELLFGELYTVLEFINDEWIKISCFNDNYEGFISKKQHTQISNSELYKINSSDNIYTTSFVSELKIDTEKHHLSLGSCINLENDNFTFYSEYIKENTFILDDNNIKNLLIKFLNVPYRWGGRSVFGIDCSGFTQVCFKILGFSLPRDAYQQAELGITINNISDIKTGDLAFFKNESNKITHVGIILDNKKIIHASGYVRIDDITKDGIVISNTNTLSHSLHSIKRLISK